MARVEYSAEINELKGSIGGTTFQRNKSGTIAKLKASLVFNPTSKQLTSQQLFNQIVSSWHSISFANKLLWNTFAATYQKYNYWNVQKNLSGFNWYMHCNTNRYLCGESFSAAPPTYATPLFCPEFQTFNLLDSVSIIFDSFPEKDSYYLFIYATPPIRSINLQSRKSLRLISVKSPNPVLFEDITAAYENYFGVSLPLATSDNSFNVLIAVSCVDTSTYISGQFFLSNSSLDVVTDYADVGDSITDLGQQFSQTQITSITYAGSGICLASTGPGGLILRSTDYGATWSSLGNQFSETNVFGIVYCGSGICLAGTYPNALILRSTDYGATWSSLGNQFSESSVFNLLYLGSGICLAGTQSLGKILRSTDYGATWSDLGQQYSETTIASLINLGSGVCLAGTSPNGHILRSTDYGATWSDLGQQYSSPAIACLIYLGSGICLAGTNPNGLILRSTDYGATWSSLGQQFSELRVLSFSYVGNGVVLAGTGNNALILRSTNYGATWSSLGQQFTQSRVLCVKALPNLSALFGTLNTAHIGIAEI